MLKLSFSTLALATVLTINCTVSYAQILNAEPAMGSITAEMNLSTPRDPKPDPGPTPGRPGRPDPGDHDDDDEDEPDRPGRPDRPDPGQPDEPDEPDEPDMPDVPGVPEAPEEAQQPQPEVPSTPTPPEEVSETDEPGTPLDPYSGVTVPRVPVGTASTTGLDRQGCGSEISRLAHIRISAYALAAIDGPVEIVEVCPQYSLLDNYADPALLHRGNVVGMSQVIAENPVLNAELAAEDFDAQDVVAVLKGNGATYVYVHEFGV